MKNCLFIFSFILVIQTSSIAEKSDSTITKKLYPHTTNIQYAGNMGFLSIGFGYFIAKKKLNLGLQIGHLPEPIGGTRIWTGSIKFAYTPWIVSKGQWEIDPLAVGINIIRSYGQDIEKKWPSYYPQGYYPWSPAMNYGLKLGSNFHYKLPKEKKYLKRIGVFYELAWTSRLIELWFDNRETIKFHEIWNFSLGAVFTLR